MQCLEPSLQHPLQGTNLCLIRLCRLGSNTIQIPSSSPRNTPPTGLFILFQNPNLFKSLQHLSIHTPRSLVMSSRTGTTVLATTVDLLKGSDTDRLAEV